MPSRLSRTTGALLALHAGDALGATFEFEPHANIAASYPQGLRSIVGGGPFGWPPGHATDDTDLTRAVLLAYADAILPAPSASTRSVTHRAADYFVHWYTGRWPNPDTDKGESPRDVGGSTAEGIMTYMSMGDPHTSGTGPGRAGNGSLMRCLPTALFQPDHALLVRESLDISSITHRDEDCRVACAAYNALAAALVAGADVPYALAAAERVALELEGHGGGRVRKAIALGRRLDLPRLAREGPPRDLLPGRCSGHVTESLSLAVAAVLDRRSLQDILVDVVRVGKDTDTNAAIAGGLLGARDGEEAIPRDWIGVLQFGVEFRKIATAILKVQYGEST